MHRPINSPILDQAKTRTKALKGGSLEYLGLETFNVDRKEIDLLEASFLYKGIKRTNRHMSSFRKLVAGLGSGGVEGREGILPVRDMEFRFSSVQFRWSAGYLFHDGCALLAELARPLRERLHKKTGPALGFQGPCLRVYYRVVCSDFDKDARFLAQVLTNERDLLGPLPDDRGRKEPSV